MKIFFIIFLIFSHLAQAVSESDLATLWPVRILPHFESFAQGELINAQGHRLPYRYLIQNKSARTLLILPGRSEPMRKYAEIIWDLQDLGLNIFILDHQGQGESTRFLQDPHKGYVRFFQDYVNDLELFVRTVILPQTSGERFILAHSMGGAIATHYLAQHPGHFTKAILSAPMMQINTDPYRESIARVYASFLVKIGKGTDYAPDRGPYVPEENTFESQDDTHSLERFKITKLIFELWPQSTLGGPTARWVDQSLKATRRIHRLAPKIKIPILLFQAGKDEVVRNPRQSKFCTHHKNCQLVYFAQAKHEILQEVDEIRNLALVQIQQFLQ